MFKCTNLFICVYRLDTAKTGKDIVANMVPVANASILYRITGISVITPHVTNNIIATGMVGMIAMTSTVAMIVETTIAVIEAVTIMIAEMVIIK